VPDLECILTAVQTNYGALKHIDEIEYSTTVALVAAIVGPLKVGKPYDQENQAGGHKEEMQMPLAVSQDGIKKEIINEDGADKPEPGTRERFRYKHILTE
jgi:hypothetical protein